MKNNKSQRQFLLIAFILNLVLLVPLALRKPPVKDWVIVYLFNALTNGIIDNVLSKKKIIKYPIKLFPKIFDTHELFDFLLYPTFTILYNQITYKDKVGSIIYKLFLITTPAFFIELWATRNTDLVKWSKKWKWYHTYFSIILKSLFTRLIIGSIRGIESKQSTG
ncbi:CBO0543 family protein [Evansella cellulosilytica]|uniref:Uncharacterized protein n=1 Tax=Evansella cellulosilytica (strain ATCC 21833 / DSM 2522 / FERM P-1141 / JCM 9156 / N-4) TaxID=649639 RepID=E6TSK8_EVAC2|nr:CBO0543 family protein [Evansella cellulosilytica]ADU29516.1 hypothetical protein Bcell_1251 [Evansella cellulosilytica DSM 2522]